MLTVSLDETAALIATGMRTCVLCKAALHVHTCPGQWRAHPAELHVSPPLVSASRG